MTTPSDALITMAQKLGRRSPLSEIERSALESLPHRLTEVGRDRYFAREGDRATHCCVLAAGFAIRHKITGNGARQIVSIHVPGDLLDVQDGTAEYSTTNGQSLSGVRIAMIPRAALLDLAMKHPSIALALWADAGANASILAEWLLNIGRRDARARVSHLICEVKLRQDAVERYGGSGPSWLMTQEQLGDATGLTPVHVNRTIQALRRQGLIGADQRALKILDWQGLCEAGDFTPEYLLLGDQHVAAGTRSIQ